MIEKRVRLLRSREWLKHVDAMYLPVPIAARYRWSDWAFVPFLATVEDVRLTTSDWILLSHDDVVLTEGLHPSLTLRKNKSPYFELAGDEAAIVRLPEEAVVVREPAVLIGNYGGYWHWLTDYLPRMYTVRSFPHLRDLRLIVGSNLTAQEQESLVLLGAAPGGLMKLDANKTYRFETLWVPSVFTDGLTPHPMVFQWLRDMFLPKVRDGEAKSRLFVSRRDASVRRLVNDEEIERPLAEWGFETIVAGALSFSEQVRRFAKAEIVVAATGAGISNLVFSPPGTTLIELHNIGSGVEFFSRLSDVLGHRYRRITGRTVPDARRLPHNYDFYVDAAMVRQAVEQVLAERTS